jgi:hypothetical protein
MNSKKVVEKQALTSQFHWMNSKKVVDKQALTSQFYWMNSYYTQWFKLSTSSLLIKD